MTSREINETLATNLREFRGELTLQAVADATDLSIGYISNLEKARGNPTLDTLVRLADAYGTEVGWLLVLVD